MAYGALARQLLEGLVMYRAQSRDTVAAQLQAHAARAPARPFLFSSAGRYSYGEANARVNQHAAAYTELGVRSGDVVALMLENRPEFLWHLYGLHKLGAIASLVNTQLHSDALAHAVRICAPKRIVVGSEVWARFGPVIERIGPGTRALVDVDVDPELPSAAEAPVWSERLRADAITDPWQPGPTLRDQAAFIYTSGTTGLPKAAIVRHDRFFRAGRVWASAA